MDIMLSESDEVVNFHNTTDSPSVFVEYRYDVVSEYEDVGKS